MESVPVQGYPIRVDPASAQVQDLPVLQGLPVEKQNRKIEAVRNGASLLEENPALPPHRPWRDLLWLTLFGVTVVGVAALAYVGFSISLTGKKLPVLVGANVTSQLPAHEHREYVHLLYSVLGGAAGAIVAAFGFVMLAHATPECTIWTSLISGPIFLILAGLAMITVTILHDAGSLLGLLACGTLVIGFCSLCCICMVWSTYVPFMVKMTMVVTDIVEHQPCLLLVPFIGVLLGLVWTVVCMAAGLGMAYYLQDYVTAEEEDSEGFSNFVYLPPLLVYFWGAGVAFNICHLTTAGVFGRWYHHGGAEYDSDSGSEFGTSGATLMPSLWVAMTTSLGSICFGSLVVALVRALGVVADMTQSDAAKEGNPVLCVVACCLKCLLQCIEDMIEYFNEWAYIQCAVRGTDLCTSAKITFSMMTCANMRYIISDLLFNSLVSLGSLLCGLAGAACGAAVAFALNGASASCGLGALAGFLVGNVAGSVALSTLSSGTKTVLACWANDPGPLRRWHPEICEEFEARIMGKLNTPMS